MLCSRKAQIIFEFVMFTLLAVFLVLILVGLAFRISSTIIHDQGLRELNDMAESIQEELILAWQVSEGYHRELFIPSRLQRGEFTINNSDELLLLSYHNLSLSLAIPPVTGVLHKGNNIIIHENETLYLNPSKCFHRSWEKSTSVHSRFHCRFLNGGDGAFTRLQYCVHLAGEEFFFFFAVAGNCYK